MLIEDICASLEYYNGALPREALAEAVRNKDAVTPKLIGFITHARNHAQEIFEQEEDYYMGHIYALYLLAQFREKAAYAPIVDLFASVPEEIIHDITGDIITEDLHRILPSVSGGDDTLIRTLVESETVSPYVRTAAVQSFVTMVVTGQKSRREAIDYYSLLFKGRLKKEPSIIWNELIACAADLHADELLGEIQKANGEGLLDPCYISIKEIKKDLKKSLETSLKRLESNKKNSLINDAIKELESWYSFKDSDTEEKHYQEKDPYPELKPVRTTPKTGRNDPCTCGSGKKFKKCCGKNV